MPRKTGKQTKRQKKKTNRDKKAKTGKKSSKKPNDSYKYKNYKKYTLVMYNMNTGKKFNKTVIRKAQTSAERNRDSKKISHLRRWEAYDSTGKKVSVDLGGFQRYGDSKRDIRTKKFTMLKTNIQSRRKK